MERRSLLGIIGLALFLACACLTVWAVTAFLGATEGIVTVTFAVAAFVLVLIWAVTS